MTEYIIPLNTQCDLQHRSDAFIIKNFPNISFRIFAVCRGKYIYLRRFTNIYSYQNLGRLTYNGDLENMPFSPFNKRTGRYDSKVKFRGSKYLDGTLEGALKGILSKFHR